MKHHRLPSKLKTPPQSLKRFSVSLRLQSRADCYLSLKCNHISKTHGSWMYSLISFDKCIHWCGVCPHHHSIFITQEAPSCPSIQAPTTPIALGDSCSHFYVHSLILPVLELHIIMASVAQIMFLNSSMLLTCTSSVLFLSDITLFKYSVLILLLYSFFSSLELLWIKML